MLRAAEEGEDDYDTTDSSAHGNALPLKRKGGYFDGSSDDGDDDDDDDDDDEEAVSRTHRTTRHANPGLLF